MKRIAIFLMCIFGAVSAVLAQQGFRVSVLNDLKEPLPHAYIYVNDKAVAVADTLGRAVIPSRKLKIGDSISVSYVATKGQSVVVDQTMLIKGEYKFILEENYGTLHANAVIVKAKLDVEKHYRKHVKTRSAFLWPSLWWSDFSMNIRKPGDNVRMVAGKLRTTKMSHYVVARALNLDKNVLDLLKRTSFWSLFQHDFPLDITTSNDTTGLSHSLQYFPSWSLEYGRMLLFRVNNPKPTAKERKDYPEATVTYSYLGKDQYNRIFRLIYSGWSGESAGITYQILVKADVNSREVLEATLSFLNVNTGDNYYIKSKIRNKTVKNTQSGNSVLWHVPSELECSIKQNDGTEIYLTMSNIDLRSAFNASDMGRLRKILKYPNPTAGIFTYDQRLERWNEERDIILEKFLREEFIK